eukprot:GHUV01051120.1.p1 GENE.GHUV01051120.1~~GHUV01051120.1.p1  ORF type:complete len:137 (-),score=53.09 GHUV01051120.1:48-458(-)
MRTCAAQHHQQLCVMNSSSAEQLQTALCVADSVCCLRLPPDAGGDSTMVGIVTFDSTVHFFNVAKGQTTPQMLVMADVNDVYAPMSSELLARLSDSREQLQELLGSIPSMFGAAAGPECCAAAAIEVSNRKHCVTQ